MVFDQASKALAVECLPRDRRQPADSRLPLRLVINERIGFGPCRRRPALVAVWAIAAAGTIAVIYQAHLFQPPPARAGLGAALGGATSNLLDKIGRGAVIDFIDLRVWPVFNLADTGIVVGVAVALWSAQWI